MAARGEDESSGRLAAGAALAALGAAIAAYLASDELGAVGRVWDPIFGSASSQAVLHSSLSRALPVPDAALGAASYALELALALALLALIRRGQHPWLDVAYGALALAMAVAGAALVAIQALWVRSFCALCLLSAAISWTVAALAFPTLTGGLRALGTPWKRRTT